jgi:hypothetical protein
MVKVYVDEQAQMFEMVMLPVPEACTVELAQPDELVTEQVKGPGNCDVVKVMLPLQSPKHLGCSLADTAKFCALASWEIIKKTSKSKRNFMLMCLRLSYKKTAV